VDIRPNHESEFGDERETGTYVFGQCMCESADPLLGLVWQIRTKSKSVRRFDPDLAQSMEWDDHCKSLRRGSIDDGQVTKSY
jgi:hypothetical protein